MDDRVPFEFVGDWQFDRVIDSTTHGRVHASGTLAIDGDAVRGELQWNEDGVMSVRGSDLPIRRTLRLRLRADQPGVWDVHFEDGRFFHPFVLDREVVHECARDVYRGMLRRHGAGWSVSWSVEGPAKSYRSVTRLRRPDPFTATTDRR